MGMNGSVCFLCCGVLECASCKERTETALLQCAHKQTKSRFLSCTGGTSECVRKRVVCVSCVCGERYMQ